MRGPWLALTLMLATRLALAGHSVIVMSEPANQGALGSAMQVALSGRGLAVATLAAPAGELRLERAADAQRAALQLGADAAVWIDEGDVCAVSADGRAFRHAPLPPGLSDVPRAFSAIATSLLDEIVAPPEPAPSVDVDVHVRVGGQDQQVTGFVDPRPDAPHVDPFRPPSAETAVIPERGIPRSNRTLLEIGPMVSPVTAGVSAELSFPMAPAWRLGVMGSVDLGIFASNVFVYNGAGELRRVVTGDRNHFDVGITGGFASANENSSSSTIGYVGFPLTYTWEGDTRGTTLAFVPLYATDGRGGFPGAYASLRWAFPL